MKDVSSCHIVVDSKFLNVPNLNLFHVENTWTVHRDCTQIIPWCEHLHVNDIVFDMKLKNHI